MGFRIDPEEKLKATRQEIQSLHKVANDKPEFGVHFESEEAPPELANLTKKTLEDDVEIDESAGAIVSAAYAEDAGDHKEAVYEPTLGLAVAGRPPERSLYEIFHGL